MVVVVCAALMAYLLESHDLGVPIVGVFEPGLHPAQVPDMGMFDASAVIIQAVPLSLLAFMEAYSVGRKYSEENHYEIDPNQDLFALGTGNIASSFFGTFVASGSFGRTALAAEVGAKTPFTNIVMACFVMVTLSCASSLMHYTPLAVLGAVIEAAVINLVDFGEMRRALRIAPLSGCVMIFTFLCTFLLTIEDGLMYEVMASLAILLYQLSSVNNLSMGVEKGDFLRHVPLDEIHTNAGPCVNGILVFRPVASLFFGNAHSLRTEFFKVIKAADNPVPPKTITPSVSTDGGPEEVEGGEDVEAPVAAAVPLPTHILIDACAIRVLDLTALGAICDIADEAEDRGIRVIMTNCSHRLQNLFTACGMWEALGGPLCVRSTEEVYAMVVEEEMEEGTVEKKETFQKQLTKMLSMAVNKTS